MRNRSKRKQIIAVLIFTILSFSGSVLCQEGTIITEVVHGKSLEDTVTKENPDREVSIYLPPSYNSAPNKRYPVLFMLHGIADTDKSWTSQWSTQDDDTLIPFSTIQEMMNEGIKKQIGLEVFT